ncbi:MAG: tetratricopeptide repeat protein [Chitinivibrionales bacterium]|nr:tetratricopeptide repeat protein [Chitinivibrionales bacterium]
MKHSPSIASSIKPVFLIAAVVFCTAFVAQGQLKGTGGYDAPYFQADFYQDLTEYSAALVNPALTYRVNQYHVNIGIYRWEAGGWGFQQLAFLAPIRKNHTAGLTLLYAGASIEETQITDNYQIVTTNAKVNYGDAWIIGNYGIRLMPWLMLGTNIKYRIQNQFNDLRFSSLPGFDIGGYFNPLDHYRFGDLGFSLNLQDIIPSRITWDSDSTFTSTTRGRGGIRYSVFNDRLIGAFEIVIDNAFVDLWNAFLDLDGDVDSLGKEVDNLDQLRKEVRYGVHVKYQFIPQLYLKGGWNNNNIPYLGINMNIMYPLPEMINYLAADIHLGYSFLENIVDQTNERGFTFMGKFSADFGPTREQRESQRLYDKLILAPMNAYNEAMKLYHAGKYWEAGFAFGKVMTLFPNFHLNDKASYYMGNSYRYLYMHDISREVYQEALDKYSTSEMRPRYLYGLMNIDYREGKYDDALKNHAFIVNLYPESDIRADADYLAGEVHFARKNYHAAEQLFVQIKPSDPPYLYAQYTLAIINIENNRIQAARQNLKTIVEDTTQDESKILLLDAANTKLGHLYYEEVELRQAVESYKRVTHPTPYGDEALLGMSWSWIKGNQPEQCMSTLRPLFSLYPNSPLIAEAHLLAGYAQMLMKKYAQAEQNLQKCISLCGGDFITDEDLQARTRQFDGVVRDFKPTGDRIKKNALRRPTNQTIEERAELKSEYDTFSEENTSYFNYTLLAKSHKKFLRREEQILEDAEYALAKVASMSQGKTGAREIEKERKEAEEIDEEIQKLQQQLQEFEQ